MKLSTFIFLFVVFGAFLLFVSGGYNLSNSKDQKAYLVRFGSWALQLTKNVVHITMYAIKQPWLPRGVNVTNVTNKVMDKYVINASNSSSAP